MTASSEHGPRQAPGPTILGPALATPLSLVVVWTLLSNLCTDTTPALVLGAAQYKAQEKMGLVANTHLIIHLNINITQSRVNNFYVFRKILIIIILIYCKAYHKMSNNILNLIYLDSNVRKETRVPGSS